MAGGLCAKEGDGPGTLEPTRQFHVGQRPVFATCSRETIAGGAGRDSVQIRERLLEVGVVGMTGRMPAAFISHGAARMTIENNSRTAKWADFGRRVPRPRAILVVSAHWFINASAVTAMSRPRTVHDFFYQSPEMYSFEYPAPGDPSLAERMVTLVEPTWLGLDVDSWGLDHGSYSVLAHAFPKADVPVVQLSVHASMPFRYHIELGAQLSALRNEGILVLASGTLVHNARAHGEAARQNGDLDLARSFVEEAGRVMASNPDEADKLEGHPGYLVCSPTPDHFLPLLYLAGLAVDSAEQATPLFEDASSPFGPCSFAIGMA